MHLEARGRRGVAVAVGRRKGERQRRVVLALGRAIIQIVAEGERIAAVGGVRQLHREHGPRTRLRGQRLAVGRQAIGDCHAIRGQVERRERRQRIGGERHRTVVRARLRRRIVVVRIPVDVQRHRPGRRRRRAFDDGLQADGARTQRHGIGDGGGQRARYRVAIAVGRGEVKRQIDRIESRCAAVVIQRLVLGNDIAAGVAGIGQGDGEDDMRRSRQPSHRPGTAVGSRCCRYRRRARCRC